MQLLNGVRVLDATKLLPGGFGTLMLADLGAEVIRIEDPAEADHGRWGSTLADQDRVIYQTLNRNKKSVVLDLKKPEGRGILLRLAAKADVFVESYRPSVKDRLGIAYKDMDAVNPRIIYCSISGFGQDGPYRDRVAHDLNIQALGGVLAITGEQDGPPIIPGVQVADIGGAASTAAISILGALYAREHTGRGQCLDVAMLDGVISWLSVHAAEHLGLDHLLRRGQMWLSGKWACYRVYRTRDDRYLALGALEPKFWARFCAAIGLDEMASFQYVEDAQEEAGARVQEVLLERTRQEWMDFLGEQELCCEPVLEIEEALTHPQVKHRGLVLEMKDKDGATIRVSGTPFSTGPEDRTPAPAIGQHTREVLTSLGYGAEEQARLEAAGVIYREEKAGT